jgi:hypothetical protein
MERKVLQRMEGKPGGLHGDWR